MEGKCLQISKHVKGRWMEGLKSQRSITTFYTICGHEWLSNFIKYPLSLCFLGAARQRSGALPSVLVPSLFTILLGAFFIAWHRR